MFRQKFCGTLLLSTPTVIWAPTIQQWFSFEALGGSLASRWVPAIFGTLVFGYGGWVFVQGALNEIRDRLPGMMTLISLAISVAFIFSLAVTFGFPGSDLWWELATLVTIMVLARPVGSNEINLAGTGCLEGTRETPSGYGHSGSWRQSGDDCRFRVTSGRRHPDSSGREYFG
jgi:Cu2+-exporting ATPase